MKNNELANLHEELLHFLLNYRKASKYFNNPNFLFRPAHDLEALREGRWFHDSPDSGWVNLFFTHSGEKKHWVNNLYFGINLDRRWNIGAFLGYPPIEATAQFWEHLIQSFSNIVKQDKPDRIRERFNSKQILLVPLDQNYRTGLPEAFDTLFQFFRQKQSAIEESDKKNFPLSLIPEHSFLESLQRLNEYRNQQKVERVYLTGFQIKRYQGIEATQLYELPPEASWIFLTGENSFGKTCLLKALAIGLYGDAEDIIVPRNKEVEIAVSYTDVYHAERKITINNNIQQPLFFQSLKTLVAYGPSRLEIQAQDSHKQQAKNSTATYNLFHTDGILKNIESELLISYYDAPARFEELGKMLKALIPSLEKIELDKEQRKILYYEKAITDQEQTGIFGPVEYENLASGIRSIIAMVGDIYMRLSDAQRKMRIDLLGKTGLEIPGRDYSSLAPSELFGIVIIDELDLHLHPKWQRELPGLLSEVFPHVQFIASTHSPIPLLGAPPHSIFLKVLRTMKNGIEVKRLTELEKKLRNLLPNSILTSPIFDLEHIFPVTHDRSEPIETADYYRTILAKNNLEEELHQLAKNFKFPEALKKENDEKGQ